jgi:hypothetical protein
MGLITQKEMEEDLFWIGLVSKSTASRRNEPRITNLPYAPNTLAPLDEEGEEETRYTI